MLVYTTKMRKKTAAIPKGISAVFGWNVGLAQREAQIAARETSKNLGLRALTSTDFLYSGSSDKILADSTGV